MRKHVSFIAVLGLSILCGCSLSVENNSTTIVITNEEPIMTNSSLDYIQNEYLLDSSFKKDLASFSSELVSNAIYASNNGSGNGTRSNPYSLDDALDHIKPGDTLYLLEGIYSLEDTLYVSKSGTKDKYITISVFPGDKVTFTSKMKGDEQVLCSIEGSYIRIEGIAFSGVTAKDACGIAMYGGGQSYIAIQNCTFENINTTKNDDSDYGAHAILLMGENKSSMNNIYIGNNIVKNNTLGFSEAISVAGNCEGIYVMDNTLYNNSNIGIDFYGNAGYCSIASLDQPRYCIAAGNTVSYSNSYYASSAGIYCDGARNILITHNIVTDSQYGIEVGSEEKNLKYPVKSITVSNNKVINNTECGIRVGGYDLETSGICYGVDLINNELQNNHVELIFGMSDGVIVENNTIEGDKLIETEDFTANDVKNVVFKNNTMTSTNLYPISYLGKDYSIDNFKER